MDILTDKNILTWLSMNPQWIPIPVGPAAETWIRDNGILRNQHGKSRGMVSKTATNDDAFSISGMAGEWACSQVFGAEIGRITGNTREELNEGDLLINGLKIEVKTGRDPYPNRWDMIENSDKLHKNVNRPYVHVITALHPKTLIVTGWCMGKQILDEGRQSKNNGAGHGIYVLPRHKLKDPMTFYKFFGIKVPPLMIEVGKLLGRNYGIVNP